MLLEEVFLAALCMSLVPSTLTQEEAAAEPLGLGNITESVVIIEKRGDTPDVIIDTYLRKIFLGNEEVTVSPPDDPHILPKTDAPQIHHVTTVSILQNGNSNEQDIENEEEEEEEIEEEDDTLKGKVPTTATQPSTTAFLDDNFNYFSCFKGRRLLRKCYLIFQHFENYETAQKLCHSRGGNLAMPIDEQEYAALAKYIHDSFYPFNWHIWIGINDLHTEGMYQYENGHRVSFFNWYKDHMIVQPNGKTLENCISVTSIDGKWWDHDCARRMFYVCEY
uniref:C-type lectin domain family 11 member A n=1 Tax=Xenopus tropicalis TaxID=8364 RepID=A0A803JNZ8_XENTR